MPSRSLSGKRHTRSALTASVFRRLTWPNNVRASQTSGARSSACTSSGCFVIPNPWDAGSARFLQSLGFKALATTSAGFAWSKGRPDNGVTRDMVIAHLHEMVAATDLPVNADFESGFAADAAGVAESVRLAIETGVAGLSIEDSTGNATHPLYRTRRCGRAHACGARGHRQGRRRRAAGRPRRVLHRGPARPW